MRRSFLLGSIVLGVGCASFALVAFAQNPAWPNRSASRDDLMNPGNWPDDPGYGFDILGMTEGTGDDNGGEWVMWSWVPPASMTVPGFRREEEMMGAGMHIDRAWQRTIGDPRVIIAVLDSGIKWDERDQRNKWYLSVAELPEPQNADGTSTPGVHDLNGDGVFNMRDWDADARVTDLNENGFTDPQDLIAIFSDGVDDDANGYIDDISGWDFFQDDNDPEDETRFGHGTGEARDSGSEGNNGMGTVGVCPRCTLLMVRVGDSFVVDVQDYARAVVFAVDSNASVVQEALGSVNHSTLMRRAHRYAYENGVAISASAADENSRHHNFPGTSNHVMYVHAIVFDDNQPQTSTTFLNFNTCTNYGGQLMMSVSGEGCSSEAVGRTAGMAGLLYSAAISPDRPGGPLHPALSNEEVRQLFIGTVDDIDIPESQPDHPEWDDSKYPSSPGWDQRFGYGRPNARAAVDAISEGRIPPEVQVETPIWFDVLYPDRTPTVSLTGVARARRAPSFDLEVAYAAGIEPTEDDFEQIRMETGLTEGIDGGEIARWDIGSLEIDNPGEVENRYS
ncbi:MAG: S8 family serine peptidase, partial [Deltaproteobacteria bacterium]|nr:S8 family serine peptidase [Deltaproteobacteria bacterium]